MGGRNRRCREEEKAGRVKNKIKGGRRRWMKKGEYGGRNEKERGGGRVVISESEG